MDEDNKSIKLNENILKDEEIEKKKEYDYMIGLLSFRKDELILPEESEN